MAPRRLWISIGFILGGVLLSSIGVQVGIDVLNTLGGTLILAGIILALMATPYWTRLITRVPPMPRLFPKVPAESRWCDRCGTVAPAQGACPSCGHAPPPRPAPAAKRP